jgi:hypothetical protein
MKLASFLENLFIQLYALFPGGGGYQGKSSRLMVIAFTVDE